MQNISRDSFTRANAGTLGANWTANSGTTTTAALGITSNAAQPQTTGGRGAAFWSATGSSVFANNQYSECTANCSATSTNNHLCGPTVRASAGDNYYLFTWNQNNNATNIQIASVVGGVFTNLINTTSDLLTSGAVMRLEIVGFVLTGYINGAQVLQVTDAGNSLASGAPGVTAFMAAASPTSNVTNWEGGDLIWTRQGTVIAVSQTHTSGRGNQEPTVIYEGNAQILSGNVFKMWHTDGWLSPVPVIDYAESTDGINWTEYASNPVIANGATAVNHGFVTHVGNTYYGYFANGSPASQLDVWQSSNGVTGWTKTNSAVLTASAGTWVNGGPYNPVVWVQGSTWYMLYTGSNASGVYSIGLATSPDGVTWTNYASNPVISNHGCGNDKILVKVGTTYYLWAHGVYVGGGTNLPTDIAIFSSPDLHTWTPSTINPIYERVLVDEGVIAPTAGQVADGSMVTVNGTTYLYYDTTNAQSSGNIHINCATAPLTLSQLVGLAFPATHSGAGLLLGVG